ncbi:hypothetical protein ACFZBU_11445 [Embleya sp. NPDC008237]|uniref:hypothetical protein n=1 Tax=Embleya sp. NPDC008237 TaxID=3363978 RepID=UPI0036E67897
MPTTRHEELRAAVTAARRALAAHPDAATSPALADLIAAAEPFANFAPAVPPPKRRASADPARRSERSGTDDDTGSDDADVLIQDTLDDEARGPAPHPRGAQPGGDGPPGVHAAVAGPPSSMP